MSENKEKVPKIRFPGFTDAWEQRRLGELGSVEMNKRIFKNQTTGTGDVPFYKIGTFGEEADAYISRELFEEYKRKYPYPQLGDILISASGSIGRTVVYQGADEYFQDSNIVWFKHDERLENSFLKQFYSVVKWQGLEGSTIKRLYNKNILETEIIVPEPAEQKKIGAFFEQIDHLITLHQRKLNNVQNLKSGLLQKMFPKNGEDFPEVRFPGFTSAWEQRKLGEVAEIKDSARVPNDLWKNSGIPYLRSSDLSSGHTEGELFLSEQSYEFYQKKTGAPQKGDLLFASGGDIGLTFYKRDNSPVYVQGGSILYVKTSENKILSGLFLSKAFGSPAVKKYFADASTGTTIKHFVLQPANDTPISFPKIDEQEQIGVFFDELDYLITLHQRKLKHLQDQKKALLQQMFV